ncbi:MULTISPECIES: hypothetical protein [unclassified Nostoc]|uniref:hypothetical protein n=1 Tax=unclassified Nostoc TaxID=2593658 RepID=UPI001DB7ABFC|nr:hypothetical protein [Nostoc sp. JL23]MBN3875798.1 hypothetical protein [Nostoc sp. JL23]
MRKIKSFILAFSLSPLLLSAWQLPSQAQLSQDSPSKGTAGSVSGNNGGAASISVFSTPVTVQTGGATTSGNITATTNASGTLVITVSPAIQTAVNTAGQNAVVALQTGGLTQQEVASLIASVAPTIVNSTQAQVPGGILLQTGTGLGQSFSTLGAAIASLSTSISALPANGSISLQIGGTTIVISNP